MSRSPLSLLLDFDAQYQRDRNQTPAFLHRRDRRLALAREERGAGALSIADWLHAVDADGRHERRPLRRWRRATLAFTAAGAVLGVLTMLGLLYVTGPARINVTLFVALALLQLLLALATAGQAFAGWRPWGALFDRGNDGGVPVLRQLQPQLAARAAQAGGLAFALTALATLLIQVLIRDLAFGWSTTLQTSAPAYQQLMESLAWPWRAWLPVAVPGPELVAQSRYFRLEGGTPADPALLGGWWPFLTMLWLCYVVLPRLALLVISRWHLNRRARRLLRDHPGHAALRERFTTPWVDNGDDEPASAPLARPGDTPAPAPPDDAGTLIRWAGADHPLPESPTRVLDAGGNASLEQDRDTLNQADPALPVWLLVRAWEPPTGDLADFLDDARAHWGPHTPIAVLPLADDDTALAPWHRFIERRGDPALLLCPPTATAREANP